MTRLFPRPASLLLACAAPLFIAGCTSAPGKPKPGPEVPRPDTILDFATLYRQNCAACHGANGRNGAAISLANPVYLAIAGASNIERITAQGVPGTAMPPFAKANGGMLTDQQIHALTRGLMQTWGNSQTLGGIETPAYAAPLGDAAAGQQAFTVFCAHCHGADATGGKTDNGIVAGSLVDPSYLALISDQGLHSFILAGQPEQGMPDWRSHPGAQTNRPLTSQDIADIVAWLASHRIAAPGQPYAQKP